MDFDEVVKKRKMIREYQQDREIPITIIDKLLKNAHRSPSAGHTQVQEFIAVIDPAAAQASQSHEFKMTFEG
jgi:nitroreductase